jgi:hypothetical protein
MDEPVRALIAVAVYLVCVVGSIGTFLVTVSDVLAHEQHTTRRDLFEAIGATFLLLFVIAGGFFWFKLIGVGLGG